MPETNTQAYVVKMLGNVSDVDPVNDNVDVFVYFDTGVKYVATFFTIENIRRLFEKNRATGECANGKYLWAANMVIVERLDEDTISRAVADLIQNGEFKRVFDGPHEID